MSDTAIAEVQRRATEKLPHFVYPPAKPKLTSSGQSLILVSDNLEKHEMLIKATLATTTVVAVKYDTWSLDALWEAIERRVPAGTKFDAVGILDHGAPGRFCLLKSVGGGDIDLADLASSDLAAFLKALGGLVIPGGRIDLLGCSVASGPAGRALLAQVEALTGVTVTASTDKTGGAEGANWVMETDNLQVIPSYFHADKLGEWKEAAFLFLAAGLAFLGGTAAIGAWTNRDRRQRLDAERQEAIRNRSGIDHW